MKQVSVQEGCNRYYEVRNIAKFYGRRNFLYVSEEFILEKFSDHFKDKAILDLGVGGGRTTSFLTALSQSYVGLDIAPKMIEHCRRNYPGVDFRVGDAANMDLFADESFDTVFFSGCGIDSTAPDVRVAIIEEVRRILKDRGLFVFSSINMHWDKRKPAHKFVGFKLDLNPIHLVWENSRRILFYLTGLWYYRKTRSQEYVGDGYEMRARQAANYSIINYCTTKKHQVEQLESLGFSNVRIVGFDKLVEVDEPRGDRWFYYIAEKGR